MSSGYEAEPPVEGGWQAVYLYHNLFHGLVSSLPHAAAAAAQTEMPTCLLANRKIWAEALAGSKKNPWVFFQSWLLLIFHPPLLCAKACDGPCLSLAERSPIFCVEELLFSYLLQIVMNSILFICLLQPQHQCISLEGKFESTVRF